MAVGVCFWFSVIKLTIGSKDGLEKKDGDGGWVGSGGGCQVKADFDESSGGGLSGSVVVWCVSSGYGGESVMLTVGIWSAACGCLAGGRDQWKKRRIVATATAYGGCGQMALVLLFF